MKPKTPITELELSPPVAGVLAAAGIETVEDVLAMVPACEEIVEAVRQLGEAVDKEVNNHGNNSKES